MIWTPSITVRWSLAWAIIAVSIALTCPAATASENPGSIGIAPALSGKTTLEDNHFSYSVPAGAHLEDGVLILSTSRQEVAAEVYPVDAVRSSMGGYAAGQRTPAPTGVGSWIRMARSQVTLHQNRVAQVRFSLHVPQNATPGDHVGAIVVSVEGTPTASGYRVERRLALRVTVRVLGIVTPRLRLNAFRYDSRNHTFSLDVTNDGNVLVGIAAVIDAGGRRLRLTQTGVYVIPGGSAHFVADWRDRPTFGHVRAQALITGLVADRSPIRLRSNVITLWLVPWLSIGLAAAVTLGLGGIVWGQRRRIIAAHRRRAAWRARKKEFMVEYAERD
jgi:hypothetical protein